VSEVPAVSTRFDTGWNDVPTKAVGRICGIRAARLEKCLALQIHSLQTRVRDRLELIADPYSGQPCLGGQ